MHGLSELEAQGNKPKNLHSQSLLNQWLALLSHQMEQILLLRSLLGFSQFCRSQLCQSHSGFSHLGYSKMGHSKLGPSQFRHSQVGYYLPWLVQPSFRKSLSKSGQLFHNPGQCHINQWFVLPSHYSFQL